MPLYSSDWDDWYQTVDAEERDFTLRGLPSSRGNIANEGAVLDPLPFRVALENARSLQRALTGEETTGILTDPASGHVHEEGYDAVMPWCQIASYSFVTNKYGGTSGSVPHRMGYIVDSGTYRSILRAPLVVPIGQTRIVPVFYVKVAFANVLTVKFEVYDSDNYNTTVIAACETSIGTGSVDGGVVADETGLDVSGVAVNGDGFRVVYLNVEVKCSALTAAIREVVIRLPYLGYRQKEERTEIDTSYLEADRVLDVDTLEALYVNNPLYLRRSIYGTTYRLPGRSLPHNHGEQRGELLKRGVLHTCFGPYNFEDFGVSTGGIIGIPIPYSTEVDFATTPKLLTSQIVFFPGQAKTIKVFIVGYLDGSSAPRTYTMLVELRSLSDSKNEPQDNATNDHVASATLSRASNGYDGTSITLDASDFGNLGQDRLFELNFWLVTTPASTEEYRLTGIAAYVSAAASNAFLAENDSHPAKEQIALMRVRENQEINSLLTAQMRAVSNQLSREALGGVPGLRNDLSTPNTSRAWKTKVQEPHQHRGTFTDVMGKLVFDGAVIRQPLFSQAYLGRVTDDENTELDYQADSNAPSLGVRIHSGGSLNDEDWVIFEHTVSIPQGLGAFDLYGVLNLVNTEPRARLFCFVELLQEGTSGNLATSIRCGEFEATDNITGKNDTALYCEVLPKDSPSFAKNATRIRRGLGCWTLDALREEATIPDFMFERPYRTTQPIRVTIAPVYSGAHRLRVRWALQTGDYTLPINGTYPLNDRLFAMFAVPSKGF